MKVFNLFEMARWAPEDGGAGAGAEPAAGAGAGEGKLEEPASGVAPAEPKPEEKPTEVKPEEKPAEGKPAETKEDWRDRRIAKLTARLKEAEAKPKAGEGEAKPEGEAPAPAQPTEEQIRARIKQEAAQQAEWDKFNEACNAAAAQGREDYGKEAFNSSIDKLTKNLVDREDKASVDAYNEFLQAALETGEAPRLLYELGQNLDEAERILSLPPIKRAVALAKLAAREPEKISSAPKPINPIGNRGASHQHIEPDDPERGDRLTTAEWMKRREEQVAKQRATRH